MSKAHVIQKRATWRPL